MPERRTEPVAVVNGGFEDGLAGWKATANGPFGVAASAARAGKASLRFDASAASQYTPSCKQALQGIAPGIYELSFQIKARDLQPPERGAGGVRVSIEYQTAGGRAWPSTAVFNGTFDWQQVKLSVLIPPDVKDNIVAISVHRYGSPRGGEVWLDEFALDRVRPPDVECFLLQPNYRGYLPADGPQRVRMWVKVNAANPAGAARVEAVPAGAAKPVASATLDAGKVEGVVELDASSWPAGAYELRAVLGDYRYGPYVVRKITADERARLGVWFDADNVLHVGGKALFPLGAYNTVAKFGQVDEPDLARLDELASASVNFNINYWWWPCDLATRRRYMTAMGRRGIWYLDTVMPFQPGKTGLKPDQLPIGRELLPDSPGRLDTAEACDRFLSLLAGRMRELPAHAGWYVMDERPFGMVPAIFHQCSVLRQADPDHPAFGVSNLPAELFLWRDTLDVFGLDPYPLMNMKADRPLSLVGQWTRAGVEATHASRPVWTVIQFFQGWSTDRWPTEEELRTMSLMAVTEGARGVFFWSFGARALANVADPKRREEYRQRAAKVAAELRSLEPALIAPDSPGVVTGVSDAHVRWRARTAGGKWYVFAYLPAEKFSQRDQTPPREVTFTLQDGQTAALKLRPDTADWFSAAPR